jgi:hypothetical protein
MFNFLRDIFQPREVQVRRHAHEIRDFLKSKKAEKLPINAEELEVLAFKTAATKGKRKLKKFHFGEIKTIYHELIADYGFRLYEKEKRNALLILHSNKNEYYYRLRPDRTALYINGTGLALIDRKWQVFNRSGRKKLAHFNFIDESHTEFCIGKEQCAMFNTGIKATDQFARAIQFMQPVGDAQMHLFVAVLFLYLIEQQTNL